MAWFQLDPSKSHTDMVITNESLSLTSTSTDYRVAMASVGFSRGVHYWETTVDRHDLNADVVVGVARKCVNKEIMLGELIE